MQQEEISPETIKLLEEMKEDLLRHRGKGYVPYQQESEEFSQRLEVATILNGLYLIRYLLWIIW